MKTKIQALSKNFSFILLVGMIFFVVDVLVKAYVTRMQQPFEIGNFFAIRFVANEQLAFSLPMHRTMIIVFSALILIGLLQYFAVCARDGLYGQLWALNFIIWGAFGNLYDRLLSGHVVDYLQFGILPIFNISDVAIVLGFFALVYHIQKQEQLMAFAPA